jgi:hypothetical protein
LFFAPCPVILQISRIRYPYGAIWHHFRITMHLTVGIMHPLVPSCIILGTVIHFTVRAPVSTSTACLSPDPCPPLACPLTDPCLPPCQPLPFPQRRVTSTPCRPSAGATSVEAPSSAVRPLPNTAAKTGRTLHFATTPSCCLLRTWRPLPPCSPRGRLRLLLHPRRRSHPSSSTLLASGTPAVRPLAGLNCPPLKLRFFSSTGCPHTRFTYDPNNPKHENNQNIQTIRTQIARFLIRSRTQPQRIFGASVR